MLDVHSSHHAAQSKTRSCNCTTSHIGMSDVWNWPNACLTGVTSLCRRTCNASDPACLASCICVTAPCQCSRTPVLRCLLRMWLASSFTWRESCLSAAPKVQELNALAYCLLAQKVRAVPCLALLTADTAAHVFHCCKAEVSRTKLL